MNKILIADDSKLIVSLISSYLRAQNPSNTLLVAYDGKEAIEIARVEQPDLILMDWQMPNMSGIDALKELKNDDSTKDIPVVMLTASEAVSEAFRHGATDFIQKPFQKEEFMTRVNNLLEVINAKKLQHQPADHGSNDTIQQEIISLEVEKEKLKHLKDTLIRQKKELTATIGMAKTFHQQYYIENEIIQTSFSDSYIISIPVLDIPSHCILAKKVSTGIWFNMVCYDRKGIQSFFLSAAIDKKFQRFFENHPDCSDINLAFQHLLADYQQLASDVQFKFMLCYINNDNLTLYSKGTCVPLLLFQNNKLIELTSGMVTLDSSSNRIQLQKGDIIYAIRDGFVETDTANVLITSALADFIKKNATLSFSEQKNLFLNTIKTFQKDIRQQNDLLIVAIKI